MQHYFLQLFTKWADCGRVRRQDFTTKLCVSNSMAIVEALQPARARLETLRISVWIELLEKRQSLFLHQWARNRSTFRSLLAEPLPTSVIHQIVFSIMNNTPLFSIRWRLTGSDGVRYLLAIFPNISDCRLRNTKFLTNYSLRGTFLKHLYDVQLRLQSQNRALSLLRNSCHLRSLSGNVVNVTHSRAHWMRAHCTAHIKTKLHTKKFQLPHARDWLRKCTLENRSPCFPWQPVLQVPGIQTCPYLGRPDKRRLSVLQRGIHFMGYSIMDMFPSKEWEKRLLWLSWSHWWSIKQMDVPKMNWKSKRACELCTLMQECSLI